MSNYLPPGTTDADIDRLYSKAEECDDYTMSDYLEEINDETWENDEKLLALSQAQDEMDRAWFSRVAEWEI